ncbi:8-oxo-dGTP pyrophosphatase MutT (NUDIX family) [Salirhabdus euzebyi]|uniref:8-oxo-dGTP pyrophosphatase MutT (NUDIX family) n=1 Tax=Salirhabdus euzebyi TaxID=394506 RepID=A0A841Q4G2_9BACI|nr:CoA pyrophosphatase [Salirhabdus euzebyi]MBB6453242.1 8-oxo-dGTP pyrophosphatase MutT (NUDIX family) [Salirhabdus euzebyi]
MNIEDIFKRINQHPPTILGSESFAKFSVLLPLMEKNNEIHVLFEVRSRQLRRQPGEICFPGGKIDKKDSSAEAAAIRETTEELGIGKEQISNVYPLDYLVSPFGMVIYSHVGFIKRPSLIKANHAEVEEIFTVPLSFFLKHKPEIHLIHTKLEPEESFPLHLIPGGENYNWRTRSIEEFFYIYDQKVIWGLTARILAHFVEVLKANR